MTSWWAIVSSSASCLEWKQLPDGLTLTTTCGVHLKTHINLKTHSGWKPNFKTHSGEKSNKCNQCAEISEGFINYSCSLFFAFCHIHHRGRSLIISNETLWSECVWKFHNHLHTFVLWIDPGIQFENTQWEKSNRMIYILQQMECIRIGPCHKNKTKIQKWK